MKYSNLSGKTIKGLKLTEKLEFESCSNLAVQDCTIDLQYKKNLAFDLWGCKNIQFVNCKAYNCRTLNDDGDEAHGFIVNHCKNIKFFKCLSEVDKKGMMEDHFNTFDSDSIVFDTCTATGLTRKTGTAFCIDKGSRNITIINCVGQNLSFSGITVADGTGHRIENTTISRPLYSCIGISDEWYDGAVISVTLKNNNLRVAKGGELVYIRKSKNVKVVQE